jgi:hypothetical protein
MVILKRPVHARLKVKIRGIDGVVRFRNSDNVVDVGCMSMDRLPERYSGLPLDTLHFVAESESQNEN